jgi:NADPH:quinone reductase-like Zn-dependent oxidoreductase
MMKGISVAEFGAPDVMKLADVPKPEPKDGEVLVKVYAAGINPVETYKRAGTYAKHLLPALPFTPGADGAGIVEALGGGVTSVAVGDRVWLSGSISGTYAEYCVSKASDVHPLPAGVGFTEGAGIGTAYRTAYRCNFFVFRVRMHVLIAVDTKSKQLHASRSLAVWLRSTHVRTHQITSHDRPTPPNTTHSALFTRVQGLAKKGQTVLVHGASGGVGIAAIQLAKAQGCTVIGMWAARACVFAVSAFVARVRLMRALHWRLCTKLQTVASPW